MRKKFTITLIALITLFLLVGCTNQTKLTTQTTTKENNINTQTTNNNKIKTTKEGTKYLVNPNKILSGGPPKDGIPSIDKPKFISVKDADKWIKDNELVLAINYKGVKKVYPLQILVWHEIVNDIIAKDPILITYCPLCGSGIAYERKINNKEVEFGTSGKLYNSNLVMYDRKTNTYWSQIDGKAIIGNLTGQELNEISIDTVTWRDWKKEHPDSLVLSQKTSYDRNYGKDPYGSYYEDSFLFFPVENTNDKVHPKTVIFGIEINKTYKAYKESDLKKLGTITDTVSETKIKLTIDKAGTVKIIDLNNQKEIIKERGFWFSWYAFHPNTKLYELKT